MKLFVFFGLPGTGKTFSGKVAEKYFGYHLYDGDNDLTQEMNSAIKKQASITDEMRDIFFSNLIESAKHLLRKYEKIIIHQTFIKEKYREMFVAAIPETKFVLIQTDNAIREKRLRERKYYPLDQDYARKMTLLFDRPLIKHEVIQNNSVGDESVKKQLQKILV